MSFREWFRRPWQLPAVFIVAILLPAVALSWLAWRTLEQDRALERRSIEERLQNVANAVAAGLEHRLKEISQQLQVLPGGYLVARARAGELAVARLQTDFVAAVSLGFRSPLTSMRHLLGLLEEGIVDGEERRQRYYKTLARETERLHGLVEHLLDFGRMEAGKAEYNLRQ